MAPGRKRLQRIQWGLETVPYTANAATARWRGKGSMPEDTRVIEEVEEDIGIIGGTDRTNVTLYGGALSLAEIPASFEQLQYLFAMALAGPLAGVADGIGSGFVYTTTIPTTAGVLATPFTIEGGDDFEVDRLEGCVITKISFSGTAGESLKVSATISSRYNEKSSFTAALTIPVIEDILVSLGKVYNDAIGGTIGTTQIANQILGFKLDFEPKWEWKPTMDGSLKPSFVWFTDINISGELTYEHDTAVSGTNGAKQYFRNQTPRLLQLKFEGSNLTTPGTYTKKSLIFNLPIKYTKAGAITDKNGNDTVVMGFRSRYNVTAGTAGSIVLVNEVATMP
jgi:hypothetical protein